jgi:hypothetical protein
MKLKPEEPKRNLGSELNLLCLLPPERSRPRAVITITKVNPVPAAYTTRRPYGWADLIGVVFVFNAFIVDYDRGQTVASVSAFIGAIVLVTRLC